MGLAQFGMGAIVGPAVSVIGETSTTMSLAMLGVAVAALASSSPSVWLRTPVVLIDAAR
jgi:hypothetical protein